MPKARILVADDEKDLAWAIRYSLSDDGYEVFAAHDGQEALTLAQRHQPALLILDIKMPRMSGVEVCRRIRRDPTLAAVPILFLTALGATDKIVQGFDEGGDDYIVKPFEMAELKARVRALLRRSRPAPTQSPTADASQQLVVGDLVLDLRARRVHAGEKVVDLAPKEFDLLRFLMSHPGETFSSEQLLAEVWGYTQDSASLGLVRLYINYLRGKIEPDPSNPIYVKTKPGHGYMLDRRKSSE